jgi:hypothetical protein
MLFREFNIIAAAAYAAQCAAEPKPERLLWDELSESQQNSFMQAVMAVARGEPITLEGPVFEATTKAILDFNGGQGGLALEELANIGGTVLSLELLTEDEVAERNIRETVVELLTELAERRQGGKATGDVGPAYNDRDLRSTALAVAIEQTKKATAAGMHYPPVVEAAQTFYEFLVKAPEPSWVRANALHAATSVLDGGLRPLAFVLVAEDFLTFLEPAPPEDAQGPIDQVVEPQPETVQ